MKLTELFALPFKLELSAISTVEGLYTALQVNPVVARFRQGIAAGAITEADIASFVAALTCDFQKGVAFPHEIELSGLAAALGTVPTDFAKRFLEDLSAVSVMEMPKSPKIAAAALRDHLGRFGQVTRRTIQLQGDMGQSLTNSNIIRVSTTAQVEQRYAA